MQSFYVSYMLRIWEQNNHDPKQFLASLEKPGTHELLNFNDIDDLFAFLRNQIPLNQKSNFNQSQEGTQE